MSIQNLFRTALKSVGSNKLRSFLTMLGVIIGVASVITMLALGNGARAAVDETFKHLGANQIQLGQRMAFTDGEYEAVGENLTSHDGLQLLETIPEIQRIDMSIANNLKIRYNRSTLNMNVIGSTAQALERLIAEGGYQPVGWSGVHPLTPEEIIAEGRFFSKSEVLEAAPVCVLGSQTKLDLFGGDSAINQTIWLDRTRCTVIGVLKELETVDVANRYNTNPNILLILPIHTMIQNFYDEEPSLEMVVHVNQADQIPYVKEKITESLREWHHIELDEEGEYKDDFSIVTRKDILGQRQEAANTFAVLLSAMATVSLVVGGIGIMNVMLVSVAERTQEIGLRRALGARNSDIVNQFLLESRLYQYQRWYFRHYFRHFYYSNRRYAQSGNGCFIA